MMVPAQYAPVLQKLAAIDGMKPDTEDNVKAADKEVKDNMGDKKKSLNQLFDKGKDNSVAKYFPGKTKKVTSDPFLKVAFAHALSNAPTARTTGEAGVMFLGFRDELEQIQASR